MATKLFLTTATSDYGTGNNDAKIAGGASGWIVQALSLSVGSGFTDLIANTVAGPTTGIEITGGSGGPPYVWYSPPIDAAVTIAGSITWNIWARENNASANVAINGRLEKIDGATGAITLIDATARTTELAVSTTTSSVNNFAETPAAGVACKRGDRLRVRIYGDDSTSNMGTGFTFTLTYAGVTGGSSGDTFLTLTENLTFAAEPAGTQMFPTNTTSPVSNANINREAWTSRGTGVQTDVTNTVAGWAAPVQVTDTAGGTVVDWFTRPLTAFTLGGAVRVNARVSGSTGFDTVHRVEIAVVAGNGTGAVAWAAATWNVAYGPGEAARSHLISGDNVAVSNGQRLRIRFLIDDSSNAAMSAAGTVTLYYAGAAGATGDTFLTFTQTLTDYSPRNPGVNFQNPGVL